MIMAINSRTVRIFFRAALLLLLLSCARHPAPGNPAAEVEAQYLATLRAISEGQYPRAVQLCKDIISREPGFFRAYARLADAAAAGDALDPAIAYLDSLRGDPQRSGYAHYGLGVAYDALGEHEAAALHFQHAIEQVPQLSDAYGYKGLVDSRLRLEQPEAALDFFRERLAADPDNANLQYGIGYTYRKMKQYPEALEALERSLRLDQNLWQAYRSIGLIHFFQGDYRRALDFWTDEERLDDRADGAIGIVIAADAAARPGLHQNVVAMGLEFLGTVRCQPDPVFVDLDLLRHTDAHGFPPRLCRLRASRPVAAKIAPKGPAGLCEDRPQGDGQSQDLAREGRLAEQSAHDRHGWRGS